MATTSLPTLIRATCLVAMALPMLAAAAQPARDTTLATFNKAVAEYTAVHHRLEASIAPVEQRSEAADLSVAPAALREQLQRARATAREGAIFSPRASTLFKRLIVQTARGNAAGLRRAANDEREELGRALINQKWPGAALTTMPPDLLAVFPLLPPELQYRFVNRDLVIWDVSADLIVDVLRNAIPDR